jgi:hypothetical protein
MKASGNRRSSTAWRLLASAVLAGAIATVLAAAGSSASQTAGTTIKLIDDVQHSTTFHFVEPPPNPVTGDPTNNSAGDEILTTEPLLNTKHVRIGTAYEVLTFVTGGKLPKHPSVLRNSLVYRLKTGALFIEALNGGPAGLNAVVTGGTGAYAGARGTVQQGNVFDVIHLLP